VRLTLTHSPNHIPAAPEVQSKWKRNRTLLSERFAFIKAQRNIDQVLGFVSRFLSFTSSVGLSLRWAAIQLQLTMTVTITAQCRNSSAQLPWINVKQVTPIEGTEVERFPPERWTNNETGTSRPNQTNMSKPDGGTRSILSRMHTRTHSSHSPHLFGDALSEMKRINPTFLVCPFCQWHPKKLESLAADDHNRSLVQP